MRQLIVTENVSLDGIAAPMDGWFDPTLQDDELTAVTTEHREAADALVLGRTTYEEFAGFWPLQTDDRTGISDYLDEVDKYVASSTLEDAEWVNTTIWGGPVEEHLEALKDQPGKDIVTTGSVTLVHALLTTDLVDVYRLFVYPVIQGHGRHLFPEGMDRRLELVESRSFSSGVVLLSYRTRA